MNNQEILAVVAGENITNADLDAFLQGVPKEQKLYAQDPQFRGQFLEQMIAFRCYAKYGDAKYVSHLDLIRLFSRVFKRAGVPLTYSEGFNPHPYISIALPLSLGYTGECEFLDMIILDDMPCEEIISRMNATLPEGIVAQSAYEGGRPVREIAYSLYEISLEYVRKI